MSAPVGDGLREQIARLVAEDLCPSFHHEGYGGMFTDNAGNVSRRNVDLGPCLAHRLQANAAAARALSVVREQAEKLARELEAKADTLCPADDWPSKGDIFAAPFADALRDAAARVRSAFTTDTEATKCAPADCGCSCHRMPGVSHIAACCDAPPFGWEAKP